MTHTLVLLRHGESQWNRENRFTGWVDVPLSERGVEEARAAGRLLRAEGLAFDRAFTSLLRRAIETLHLTLSELDELWIPVEKSWRLNERMYGALQGLDKAETAARHGEAQVKLWRRSYDVPPPPLPADAPGHPSHDRRYASLRADEVPASESLRDTVARMVPYWESHLAPALRRGETVLVAAHGNSLRALVKHLESIDDDAIVELNIPTGIPRLYRLDSSLRPVERRYLGDEHAARAAAEAVARQGAAR
ncbi:MAG: 2,3-diphosphoglycerate-dependent phosphoglycerate mutase [Polyangiaceae bacterium]|nr:2,3-diphosphoglycerate-dependent phosphoglycerate mutase [Polyangiaceae bacterium]